MSKDKGNQKRKNITINDIRSTFPEETRTIEKNNLFGCFVLRRISFYLTWLFVRLGISANEVTGISILMGCIGCILLAFGSYTSMITGALILNIWALLEFVDGNVARATHSCSNYGAFIDDLNAYTVSVLFFISVGVGAFHHPDLSLNSIAINIDNGVFLFLGGWASIFYIFPRFIGNLFLKLFPEGESEVGSRLRSDVLSSTLYKINYNINNITGLVMPVLLLATIFRFLSLFICLWALIHTSAFVILIIKILRKAKVSNG